MEILKELVRIEGLIDREWTDQAIDAMRDLANNQGISCASLDNLVRAESINDLIRNLIKDDEYGYISVARLFEEVEDRYASWFAEGYGYLSNIDADTARQVYFNDLVGDLKDVLTDELSEIQTALLEQLDIIQDVLAQKVEDLESDEAFGKDLDEESLEDLQEAFEDLSYVLETLVKDIDALSADNIDDVLDELNNLDDYEGILALEDESVTAAVNEIKNILDADLELETYFNYLS